MSIAASSRPSTSSRRSYIRCRPCSVIAISVLWSCCSKGGSGCDQRSCGLRQLPELPPGLLEVTQRVAEPRLADATAAGDHVKVAVPLVERGDDQPVAAERL